MEMWVAKGLGDYPYIGTRAEYDQLPSIGRQEIIAKFPEHAEWLAADESKLPAELRLRMARRELLFEDQEALENAGYVAAVKYLSRKQQEFMLASWEATVEQQREETAANAEAVEAQWAKAQAEGLERSNRMLRQQYIRQLHSDSSVEQPTALVTIGK